MRFITASIAVFLCIGLAVQAAPAEEDNSVQEYGEEKRAVGAVWDDNDGDNDLDLLEEDDEGLLEDDADEEDGLDLDEGDNDGEVGARKKRSYGGSWKHGYKKGYGKRRHGYGYGHRRRGYGHRRRYGGYGYGGYGRHGKGYGGYGKRYGKGYGYGK